LIQVAELLGVKTIIVYDLTRLGRDLLDLIETYKYLWRKAIQHCLLST